MPANLLADRTIKNAKPAVKGNFYLRDGANLFLRVYAAGSKVFVYRYRFAGRIREVALGDYSEAFPLVAARALRNELKHLLRQGIDPAEHTMAERQRLTAELESALAVRRAEVLVSAIAEDWYRRHIANRYRRPELVRRILDTDILPPLGAMCVKDVTRGHIADALNKIVDRGSRVAANRILAIAKQIFYYAAEQGHIDKSPAADLTRRGFGGKESSRDRALTYDEIRALWRATESTEKRPVSWQVRLVLRFLLLTGQRVGEALSAQWTHIDKQESLWRIPAALTKSRRAHIVQLSDAAMEILDECRRLSPAGDFVFQSDRKETEPVTVRGVSRALHRLFGDAEKPSKMLAGGPPLAAIDLFTVHDLRRTFVSRLADIGGAPHIVEKIVNHELGGVLSVYNHGEYLRERREAMVAWGQQLQALVAVTEQKREVLSEHKKRGAGAGMRSP